MTRLSRIVAASAPCATTTRRPVEAKAAANPFATHNRNVVLCRRARAIALRIAPLPSGPMPHGFYHRPLFIERCRQSVRHNEIYRDVFARLAAKDARVARDMASELVL